MKEHDTNGDGVIDKDELAKWEKGPTYDRDHDGKVTLDEIIETMKGPSHASDDSAADKSARRRPRRPTIQVLAPAAIEARMTRISDPETAAMAAVPAARVAVVVGAAEVAMRLLPPVAHGGLWVVPTVCRLDCQPGSSNLTPMAMAKSQ